MKNFKSYLLIILAAGLPVYSCNDYLDVTPVSAFDPTYIFGNVQNATKALYGVYAQLGGDQAYGIRVSMYYAYDNDEMMGQGPGTADNERRDIAHYNVQPSNTQLANPFNQLYRGIENANNAIAYIPLSDVYNNGSESDKKAMRQLLGEALTLRAQFYYELVRNWGDVPATYVPASFTTDLFLAKTDRDEIYDRILADLADAEALVPWKSQAGVNGDRITQGAVRGLRARIALSAGGYSLHGTQMTRRSDYLDLYTIARDEAKAIMDQGEHHLNPSFQAVWKDNICHHAFEPTGEVIWEVGMSGGSSATGDSKLGYYNGPRVATKGNSALTILPTTFYAFDPNDTRRDVTCAIYDMDASGNLVARDLANIVDGKYRRDWIVPSAFASTAQYFGLNWVMLRYSDVLLMFAEAENELNGGPTGAAIAAFEEVRTRGFGGNSGLIGTTPGDQAGFFDAIVKERMLELCGEGIRKYDLIRWNLLGTKLAEVKAKMTDIINGVAPYDNVPTVMYYATPATPALNWVTSFYAPAPGSPPPGSTSVNWKNATIQTTLVDILAYAFTPGKSELLPFHTTTIDSNPNIIQNTGY